MNLLALDTSTEYCSVALLAGDELAYREIHAVQRHSELVLPMIGELLAAAGLMPRQLDVVAFGAGPGSFTGLRIACGVAQGMAFGADIPVVPIGTLVALAEESGASQVIACIDARMGEIYHATYVRQDAQWIELSAPAVCKPLDAPAVDGEGWVGVGSGFIAHGEVLKKHYGRGLERVDSTLHPHARAMVRLALPELLAGRGLPPEQATPLYVRDKVALKMHERQ